VQRVGVGEALMRYAASGRRSGSSWIEAIKVNDCRQIPSWVLGESGRGAIMIGRGHMATATPDPPAGRGLVNARPTALRSAVLLVLAVSSAWPTVAGTAALFTAWRQSGGASLDIGASGTLQQWLDRVRPDATAADAVSQIATELIIAHKAAGCNVQKATLHTNLTGTLADLLRLGRLP